jgi:hypothetical protein
MVTSLDWKTHREEGEPQELLSLVGVFHRLSTPPNQFFVHFILRRDADESVELQAKIRRRGRSEYVYEFAPESLPLDEPASSVIFGLDDLNLASGRHVLEIWGNGRLIGSRVLEWGP